MSEEEEAEKSDLWPGQVVLVLRKGASGEEEFGAVIESVAGDEIEVTTRGTIASGDVVMLQRSVRDDARYVALVDPESRDSGRYLLRKVGDWERVQEREYVRVSTHGLSLTVTGTKSKPAAPPKLAKLRRASTGESPSPGTQLVNLSAGGLRFETSNPVEADEALGFEFELPETGEVKARGRVIRVIDLEEGTTRRQVAVAFEDLDEDTYQMITRWVFAEEARRVREGSD